MLTLEEFVKYINKLALHDWFFDYSDDPSVWKRGNASHRQLVEEAAKHPVLAQALEAWEEYVLSDGRSPSGLLAKENIILMLRNQISEPLRNFG